MSTRRIFHLSIPVADLGAAKRFYSEILGATIGREQHDWLDVLLWGHQITLQCRPSEVLLPSAQGKRHFGVVLPWHEWESLAVRLREANVQFLEAPLVTLKGAPQEQAKMYLADPSHNVIEIKTYRNLSAALGYEQE
jgi:extradiol dioxygenase family protein